MTEELLDEADVGAARVRRYRPRGRYPGLSQVAGLNRMGSSAFHGPNMAAETTVHRLSQ